MKTSRPATLCFTLVVTFAFAARAARASEGKLNLDHRCKTVLETGAADLEKKAKRWERTAMGLDCSIIGLPIGSFFYIGMNRRHEAAMTLKLVSRLLSYSVYSREVIWEVRKRQALPWVREARERNLQFFNEDRENAGFAPISIVEFNAMHAIELDLPALNDKDIFDEFVDQVKQVTGKRVTYETVRAFFQSKRGTDYFCEGGEAPRLRSKQMKALMLEIADSN